METNGKTLKPMHEDTKIEIHENKLLLIYLNYKNIYLRKTYWNCKVLHREVATLSSTEVWFTSVTELFRLSTHSLPREPFSLKTTCPDARVWPG